LNNLLAVSFPGKESSITENLSTVNIFRVFFNSYFGADYEILDEKYIWYVSKNPLLQTDVTDLIKSSSLGK